MDTLISVVGKIAEYTVAPIGRQVGYLIFYKDNFKKLEERVQALEGVREQIQHSIEEERRNGKEVEVAVKNWVNKADEIVKEAKHLSQDPRRANVGCSKCSFCNLRSRHQLSRNANKMAMNIAQVQENGKFERVGYLPPLRGVGSSSATRGNEKLKSRKLMKEKIVLALKDPKLNKIGVFGLSGVGKTTTAKQVAKQVKDDELFNEVVFAKVSQASIIEIQNVIADQLGLHRFEENSPYGRARRLCERIKKEKTMLIVLDDIWGRLDLEELGIPSMDDHKGCKLLLTSRNQDALQKMETQKDFRLEVLNEEETWSLFEVMAGDAVKDGSLHNIATQVAKKCAGLPIFVVTVAGALKNKDIFYWKDALNQLERNDNGEMNEIAYSILELSYNRLESDDAKAIFLLCGVHGTRNWFSDLLKYGIGLGISDLLKYGIGVCISDLLKYGIGLGIFEREKTMEDARNRLYTIISKLKASCLLLEDDSDEEVLRMHDIICDVAMSIASRDQFVFAKQNAQFESWPNKDFLRRCTQIILTHCCIQELPQVLECPNLKFLHIDSSDNRSLEIPNCFFEGMGNLDVLDLTGMIMKCLPTSFSSLTKLKTLCLDQCALGDMIGIGALKNLEILSFIHSSMEKLPSEIGQLIHLRMLDLRYSGIEVFPPNIMSNLIKLEELNMGNISTNWEVENSAKPNRNATLAELRNLKNLTALEVQIQEAWTLPRDIMFEKLERYKIVIGDVWEWSDTNAASKMLKIKLGTNIHLEHGIKALMKSVEDLYLDEINGISNILYQLNGEGFPRLKHLYIQNNAEFQHIIDSMERNITHIFFPILKTLELHNLTRLEKICHGPLTDNSFGKLRVIKVRSCGQLQYLFSVELVKALCQLDEIEVSECNSMKMIVFLESMKSGTSIDKVEFCSLRSLTLHHLPTVDSFCSDKLTSFQTTNQNLLSTNIPMSYFNAKVGFSKLETLKLSSISMDKIWNDEEEARIANSIGNLTNIIVEDCGGLKYLFSSSLIQSLSNLKRIQISRCHEMEEIIATKGTNGAPLEEVVRFPKLDTITINDMEKLKRVWHYEFDGLKTLEVTKCEKLKNIFPSYVHATFGSLETLTVRECGSMEEIFELGSEMHSAEDTSQLKQLTLLELPKLKQIWSGDPQNILRFPNLQVVRATICQSLEYLFPFSVAMNMLQLEKISIKGAPRMKEIVAKEEGLVMDSSVIFELNHLTSLKLWFVHELTGFFAGEHSLACPSLRKLYVLDSPKLKLFKTQCTSSQGRISPSKLQVSMHQPLFTLEEVICNLETLTINNENASMILQSQIRGDYFRKLKLLRVMKFEDDQATFPYWFLQNISSLEELTVQWSSFEEIFRDERSLDEKGQIETRARLKRLRLHNLHELKHICKEGVHIDPVLELLEWLDVNDCSNLKNLATSCVTFSHLECLSIERCNGLIHLITSSVATSLVKLTTMIVKECSSLEQIVIEEEEETKDEIAFNSLKFLELECLPKLDKFISSKSFLKFPLLEKVVVQKCPRMATFSVRNTSTPMLQKIHAEEKDNKWYWEGDINKTIKKMFLDKVAFRSFERLELFEYPELKEIWYGQVREIQEDDDDMQHDKVDFGRFKHLEPHENLEMKELWYKQVGIKAFCNLKSLVVHKCDFLTNVLFPSNLLQVLYTLEELEVDDCDSLELVFDVNIMDIKEMHKKETSELKKLTLSNLSNLKHIWNKDSPQILSFGKLQHIKVTECPNLINLFSVSICQDLEQLDELMINSCGVEEIVANEEGSKELRFHFAQLTSLRLRNLTKLKCFYREKHSLDCPSLMTLDVSLCEALQIFSFGHLDSQQTIGVGEADLPVLQALFHVEKVPSNLTDLSLNEKDAMRILNGHCEKNLFTGVETLDLQYFQETPIMFLNDFLEKFPNTTRLLVRNSSFDTLFPSDKIGQCSNESPTQIKCLWLFDLKQLKNIWNDDSVPDSLVQNLKFLSVLGCSSLMRLAPPSISFTNLNILHAIGCKGLIYLMTSLTARSLVHLEYLMIENCEMIEDVVRIDEGESEEEIVFESLKHLELTSLSSFKSFCSGNLTFVFPSLVQLEVKGCPKMQNFSSGVTIAPFLKIVQVENGKRRWKEDLNTTIQQLFMEQEVPDSNKS